ncbi:hypothetical protein POF50_021810 [Streptomyces sp. SL13]|uniref:FtsK domain-containing protein n=1 Tax=Streptantibioticus silvisoli TaxID=2705255 RepID=A0AA90KA38_9ACTN|nr:hypothetical protein [Streptantibioticus silvisoli]MDI5971938.1 hypothetical protein [Streptantibioticus silvisoli]
MSRRPLPRILTDRALPSLARGRDLARNASDNAADVLKPLIAVGRGLRRHAGWVAGWWIHSAKDRRGPTLLLAVAGVVVVALLPYGPLLAGVTLLMSAGWTGRDRRPATAGPSEPERAKLQAVYEALVPYLTDPDDPAPLYTHHGDAGGVFTDHEFENGRLTLLRLRYPGYFTDGEPDSRARVEQLLHAKAGRGREYRFDWDEEDNHLTLTALPALATGIAAQRFVTSPHEAILGFTDATDVQRTIPVLRGEESWDLPPVVWRTGPRSTEPHLLALGGPGTGTTTLLRSLALQALHHGDVLVVDGAGSGEYGFLAGRPGVLGVESGLAGTLAALEWLAHETQRRLIAVNRARQAGHPAPADVRRPLWLIVDHPAALAQLARVEGRPDPQDLLDVPLRHGRAAGVTLAVAEHLDAADGLSEGLRTGTRARVLLGPAHPAQARAVLGVPPHTTQGAHLPPGRGYARLGDGAVHRLQVPATPDPHDEETTGAHREAILSLLPAAPQAVDLVKAPPETAPPVKAPPEMAPPVKAPARPTAPPRTPAPATAPVDRPTAPFTAPPTATAPPAATAPLTPPPAPATAPVDRPTAPFTAPPTATAPPTPPPPATGTAAPTAPAPAERSSGADPAPAADI